MNKILFEYYITYTESPASNYWLTNNIDYGILITTMRYLSNLTIFTYLPTYLLNDILRPQHKRYNLLANKYLYDHCRVYIYIIYYSVYFYLIYDILQQTAIEKLKLFEEICCQYIINYTLTNILNTSVHMPCGY